MKLFRRRAKRRPDDQPDTSSGQGDDNYDYGEPPEHISESIEATAAIESSEDE